MGVMLIEFVTIHKQEIISRCKAKAATRGAPESSKADADHGVPMFLDELVDELRLRRLPNPEIRNTATKHGHDLLHRGFNVSQVVHGYGDVCQSITEIAVETNAPISSDDFRLLNRCLDDAIAAAVSEFGSERDQSFEGEAADESKRLGALAHKLRISIQTARSAMDAITSGKVGIAGSTGGVLNRSLVDAQGLIDRMLTAEVFATRRIKATPIKATAMKTTAKVKSRRV
jgi:hypothetical protein